MPCLSPGSAVMSIALVRVAEVSMQECFKRRERPADARLPFVDDLFGLVEFQQPDMGEPRRQKDVWRISGHAAPGDPVLHDVHGTGDGAEDARRVVCGGFVFAEQRGAVLPDGHGDTFHEISLALFIFFRLFLGGVPPDELAVQVDGEDDVRPKRAANGNGHGIDQPAVKQPAVMIKDGREQTGKGDGRPDRFFKRAFFSQYSLPVLTSVATEA